MFLELHVICMFGNSVSEWEVSHVSVDPRCRFTVEDTAWLILPINLVIFFKNEYKECWCRIVQKNRLPEWAVNCDFLKWQCENLPWLCSYDIIYKQMKIIIIIVVLARTVVGLNPRLLLTKNALLMVLTESNTLIA